MTRGAGLASLGCIDSRRIHAGHALTAALIFISHHCNKGKGTRLFRGLARRILSTRGSNCLGASVRNVLAPFPIRFRDNRRKGLGARNSVHSSSKAPNPCFTMPKDTSPYFKHYLAPNENQKKKNAPSLIFSFPFCFRLEHLVPPCAHCAPVYRKHDRLTGTESSLLGTRPFHSSISSRM